MRFAMFIAGWFALTVFNIACDQIPNVGKPGGKSADAADDEDEDADEPAMVAGSYLACEAFEETEANITAGCRIEKEKGKRLQLTSDIAFQWNVDDRYNRAIEIDQPDLTAPNDPWAWYLDLPKERANEAKVQLELRSKSTGKKRNFSSTIRRISISKAPTPPDPIGNLNIGEWADPFTEIKEMDNDDERSACLDPKNVNITSEMTFAHSGVKVEIPFSITDKITEDFGIDFKTCYVGNSAAEKIEIIDESTGKRVWPKSDDFKIINNTVGINVVEDLGSRPGNYRLVFLTPPNHKEQKLESYVIKGLEFKAGIASWKPGKPEVTATNPWVRLYNEPTGTNNETSLDIRVEALSDRSKPLTHYKYKVGEDDEVDCDDDVDYIERPKGERIRDSLKDFSDGKLQICIVGLNKDDPNPGRNDYLLHKWTKDTTPPKATIPSRITTDSIKVSGSGVERYRYKVSSSASVECKSSTGYRESKVSTPINVSDFGHGIDLYVCLAGIDSLGNVASYSSISAIKVFKDTTPPPPPPAESPPPSTP
jgi:hypothetical protein